MTRPHPNLGMMAGGSGREEEAKRWDFFVIRWLFLQSGGIFSPPTPFWETLHLYKTFKKPKLINISKKLPLYGDSRLKTMSTCIFGASFRGYTTLKGTEMP